MDVAVKTNDRFVTVDGLNTRYLEEGSGVPAIMLHGSSLGSSADVFRRNLRALGTQGIRAIALDLPGFGKSDPSRDLGGAYRKTFIIRFMDALGLTKAALIGHSSSGNPAVSIALKQPLLLIYGRNDRARAEERAKLLKEHYPQLDLHFADGCKHLVPWDAADLFHRLAVPFLKAG